MLFIITVSYAKKASMDLHGTTASAAMSKHRRDHRLIDV